MVKKLLFHWLLHLLYAADGFYLPGVVPRTFKEGQAVHIKVQTLVSSESELQFDFYQLPFCQPAQVAERPTCNFAKSPDLQTNDHINTKMHLMARLPDGQSVWLMSTDCRCSILKALGSSAGR